MAFVVEKERRSVEWMPILVGLFAVLFLGAAVYYMFFAESAFINVITDTSDLERSAIELSRVRAQANQDQVVNDPVFRSLRQQATPLSVNNLGRLNPFQPF